MFRRTPNGFLIRLHVKPNSSKERVIDIRDGCVNVAVVGPARDGQANCGVIALMAESDASIVSGQKSRKKIMLVHSNVSKEEQPSEHAGALQKLTKAADR